jgi:hypothetical protein
MTGGARSGPRPPRVLAVIAPGHGPHLLAPSAATAWARATPDARRESLPRALAACVELLESDPPRFQRAATAWHARWCAGLPTLTLADALVTLAALEALAGPDPGAAARELSRLAIHHGHHDLARVFDRWSAGRQAVGTGQDTESTTSNATSRAGHGDGSSAAGSLGRRPSPARSSSRSSVASAASRRRATAA